MTITHRQRLHAVVLTALVSIVLMSLAFATPARAGTFTSDRCDASSGGDWTFMPLQLTYWTLEGAGCPDPLSLRLLAGNSETFLPGEFSAELELQNSTSPIESARITMTGSTGSAFGLRQGVRFCGETCTDVYTRSESNPETPEVVEFSIANGKIPEGTTTMRIAAECVNAAGCQVGDVLDPSTWRPALEFSDMSITRFDTTPPTPGFWIGGTYEYYMTGWLNDDAYISFGADDNESGVVHTRATFGPDDLVILECGHPDSLVTPPVCPDLPEYNPVIIRKDDFVQGANHFHGQAKDRAGNIGTTSTSVKVDTIAPSRPSGVVIRPGRGIWANDLNATVTWTNSTETVETLYRSGIVSAKVDIQPVGGGLYDPDPVTYDVDAIASAPLTFPSQGTWAVVIETTDRAGNVSPPANVSIDVDTTKPGPAQFSQLAPITAADRESGRLIDWSWSTTGPSGICGAAFDVNDMPSMNPGDDPDEATIVGYGSEKFLSTNQIDAIGDGLKYVHVRAFSCAGLPGVIEREPILVDTTAPTVRLDPEGGWLAPGDQAQLIAEDESVKGEQSGIAAIEYTIEGVTTRVESATAILPVLSGEHEVTFKAIDAVGNESDERTGVIRTDSSAPTAWLQRPVPSDPTLVRATAEDDESGIKSIWIELHPTDGRQPILLGEKHQVAPASTEAVTIERRIPDDTLMKAGAYRLEVHAVDLTEKHTVASIWQDGSAASVTLPLRTRPTLTAELGSRQTGFGAVHQASYGAKQTVRGRVLLPGGAPAPGVQLTIRAQQQGRGQRQIGVATSGADGGYSALLNVNSSARIIVGVSGTAQLGPATADAELKVSAGISAKPSRTRVSGKQKLMVRGRVLVGDATIPANGKIVALQYRIGRRWSRSTPTTLSFDDGRFEIPFTYRPRRGRVRMTMRAVAVVEGGWPFERGYSREFKVVLSR